MTAATTKVLFVGGANILASPIAAALMAFHARLNNTEIEVASAGLEVSGRRFHPYVANILNQRNMELRRTTSQRLSDDLVVGADLVLTMTSVQANEVVATYPDEERKVFLLDHFGQIVRPQTPESDHRKWLDSLCDHPRNYVDNPNTWDIATPVGDSEIGFRNLAGRIDELTGWIATVLAAANVKAAPGPV